ncbi:MAG: YeeE/YedE thiosulfate transporter family protein [Gammaproteobacteria bacterium]
MTGQLDWLRGGIALASAFLLAVWIVKPIGVSTQFVIADGIAWHLVKPDLVVEDASAKAGFTSENAYLAKSGGKYAKNVARPLNYSFIFVAAMIFGVWLSRKTGGPQPESADRVAPRVWRERFGSAPLPRYAAAFAGGLLVLYGARLAGGCTSGHMMSGMMQTSVSGYLFAVATFATAIPVALLLYRRSQV